MKLANAHILITGASRGIGLALAHESAARGARVTMLSSNPDGIKAAAAQVRGAVPLAADLSDMDRVAQILPEAEAANGPVDVLVNNAARMGMGPLVRLDADTLRGVLTTNFLAPAELSRAAGAKMVDRGRGSIVSVSSIAGEMALRNIPAYGSSKAGLSYITRTLQRELRGTGVLAQLVLLGGVDTELLQENLADPVAGPASRRLAKAIPAPTAEHVGERIAAYIESGRRTPLVLPAAAYGAVGLRHSLSSLADLLLAGMPLISMTTIPHALTPDDEALHPPPPEAGGLWADTVWLSAMDPAATVFGISQMHISPNKGYGRFQSLFWIDGVGQMYTGKQTGSLEFGQTSWSDGTLSYEVLEPFERLRLALDHSSFGFDFLYTARHDAFDYDDCIGGSPLAGLQPAAGIHGGHYEQAMALTGTLEIRRGPNAGDTRRIDTIAHRDHTWSDRFSSEPPWTYPEGKTAALHYWLVLQFPERHFNVTGFFDLSSLGIHRPIDAVGGFESTDAGTRPILNCELIPGEAPRGPEGPERLRLTFENGDVVHIRATKTHAIAKLLMLGVDDTESRLNDYERFCELEIEETGERGHGVIEHSTLPPEPRWLV